MVRLRLDSRIGPESFYRVLKYDQQNFAATRPRAGGMIRADRNTWQRRCGPPRSLRDSHGFCQWQGRCDQRSMDPDKDETTRGIHFCRLGQANHSGGLASGMYGSARIRPGSSFEMDGFAAAQFPRQATICVRPVTSIHFLLKCNRRPLRGVMRLSLDRPGSRSNRLA